MDFFGINNLWLFLVTASLLIISPGIDTMLVLNRSMTNGKRTGTYTILGIAVGILFHTLLGALGLSLIIAQAAYLFTVLKVIGAAYLIYLGVIKLWKTKSLRLSKGKKIPEKPIKSFTTGMITNVFNPKVALFFLAFFPQFINPQSNSTSLTFLTMGLIFIIITILWLLLINQLIAYFSKLLIKSPQAVKFIDRVSGLMFLTMGLKLAFNSRD